MVGLDEVAGTLDQLRLDRKRIIGDVINIIMIVSCDFDFTDRKQRLQCSPDNPSNILSSLLFTPFWLNVSYYDCDWFDSRDVSNRHPEANALSCNQL